jgi:ABC-type sugar transport system ATPase subunit
MRRAPGLRHLVAMSMLELRQVSKVYGQGAAEVHALREVDLEVDPGMMLAVMGPSGSGKSTLLTIAGSLEEPTSGQVLVAGQDLAAMSRNDKARLRRQSVGYVFQDFNLLPGLTAAENVALPLELDGISARKARVAGLRALDGLGLADRASNYPDQLSGGERQRVALARALVREPAVFLLDEPLSGLDAKLRATTRDELKRFQRQIGTATIYVTHDQEEAMGLADRVAVLDAGRLRQVGTPRDIYDEPADTFVATFVGAPPMNLVQRADRLVGFRPEHLLPAENVAYDSRVTMPLRIERMEYLSGDRHVYGTVTRIGLETRVIARLPATVITPLAVGETHEFAVPTDRLRFFDAEYGTRAAPVRIGG